MICDTCRTLGLRSNVYSLGATRTLMGWDAYWDERGTYHAHDPNWNTISYKCSNGHEWNERSLTKCPAGDYPK